MRILILALGLLFFCGASAAWADPFIESAQRVLKDQGFYYGEITGRKDADTTAAIRRYQIRNGLKITGEFNAETQKSLGVKGNSPTVRATPAPSWHRNSPPTIREPEPRENFVQRAPAHAEESAAAATAPDFQNIFAGSPYESALAGSQREVILRAQTQLARRGFYRSEIDGLYGPGMVAAVRAYQERYGMEANGRLDGETLAVLGLLPRQVAPGVTAPRRRFSRRPALYSPQGEPIYTPR